METKQQRMVIPLRLPGLNDVIAKNRNNRYAGAVLKKQVDADISAQIRAARLRPVCDPCIVHMVFDEPNRRRDVDNVESAKKFVLDALVKSGILIGDSPRHVIGAPAFTRYTQGGAQVTVTIIEDNDVAKLRRRLQTASAVITE